MTYPRLPPLAIPPPNPLSGHGPDPQMGRIAISWCKHRVYLIDIQILAAWLHKLRHLNESPVSAPYPGPNRHARCALLCGDGDNGQPLDHHPQQRHNKRAPRRSQGTPREGSITDRPVPSAPPTSLSRSSRRSPIPAGSASRRRPSRRRSHSWPSGGRPRACPGPRRWSSPCPS